jgi:hypothetical protein
VDCGVLNGIDAVRAGHLKPLPVCAGNEHAGNEEADAEWDADKEKLNEGDRKERKNRRDRIEPDGGCKTRRLAEFLKECAIEWFGTW